MTIDAIKTLGLMILLLLVAVAILWACGLGEGDYTINLKAPVGAYIVSGGEE